MNNHSSPEQQAVQAFIDRWQDSDGKERANYQLFLTELCQLHAQGQQQRPDRED